MLEKIGLPPKPTLRGNNWVADASHCQGCSSQFTFINRKHHCRRCGGLFCNSCTSQRMVLRGQGDSPVRICEPCKKLEEASRFEMRYGHKNRSGKGGGSKPTTKSEDEVLNQILGNEGKASMSSSMSSFSGDQDPTNGASGSTLSQGERGAIHRSMSSDQQPTDVSSSVINTTPEELRQQAVEEKKKHRTLKAEGKPEEALRAFKRGKELEREAAALEISLRKNRRKALSESISNATEISNVRVDAKVPSLENKLPPKKKEKDDLAAELRELGWSDMDLHDADDKKPAKITLEGELSKLLGEVSQGARTENGIRGAHGIDKSQVNAHKRKALELKRQGKLAEAKEELKKAKFLEKQIEEQELLGEGDEEESDEEFSSLLRSLNSDKHEDLSTGFDLDQGFEIGNIGGLGEDLVIDDDLEITQADLHDPDMLAALQSIGWTEDTDAEDFDNQLEGAATEASANEIQSIKKEALKQKRSGNSKEALALFRKAKLLEKELESASGKTSSTTDNFVIPSESLDVDVGIVHERKTPSQSKNKVAIQRELLGLKKRALALRREGKLNEAEEELKRGKVLEKQLEELETVPKVRPSSSCNKEIDESMVTDVGDEDVTDQDMTDPSYLAVLKSLGFSDDANESHPPSSSEHDDGPSSVRANVQAGVSRKSKSEIQRELLGLKRKLLVLRRQGETEEAEEMLKKAEVLESRLAEMEASTRKEHNAQSSSMAVNDESSELNGTTQNPLVDLSDAGFSTPDKQKQMVHRENQSVSESQQNDGSPPLQQDILAHKRKALALKREGKLVEAKEELRWAKLLEKRLEESKSQDNESQSSLSPSPNELSGSPDVSHDVGKKDSSPDSAPKPLSSRERFKLQQESLNHKRQALKLRREGKTEEADAEFEKAKAIEAQLEESSPQKAAEPVDDVGVEDFLDPQLFSALKAIGLDNVGSGSGLGSGSGSSQLPEKREPARQVEIKNDGSSDERVQLENQIKAEKLKALNFKRSGKQAEALDALRKARVLEKKLNSVVK